jgi:hypothetical protein
VADNALVSDGRFLMIGNTRILDTQSISTVASLIDSAGGTPSSTIPAAGGSYSQSDENNVRSSLVTQLNAITTALKNHGLFS